MKIETILSAYTITVGIFDSRRIRQGRAFRARILREFAIYKNFAEANGFDRSQAWFWTDEWQAAEREVDEDIAAGRVQSFDSMKEFLATLEGNYDSPNN